MTEDDMVERVAAAIAQTFFGSPLRPEASLEIREIVLEVARAAIMAMREPSVAMVDAATAEPCTKAIDGMVMLAFVHGCKMPSEFCSPNDIPLVRWWKAMIDAALEEPKP